ncbi:hypothetical protein BD410DRAFT_789842 [Rickenella mellea]|uniref:Uncharacterized protein n=1 Tax=Rickenella mellea TaxID=50990 RepID=A0A4Y7Q188_9AGAM|nr:hypothetical protein BD410DRAFT_789842 [Rickenella mellea]
MHSNTAVLLLALSAVTPALSAPISLGDLGKEVAKGLASGSALGGVVAGIEQLTGSGSSTTSKREFSEEDIALLNRAVSLGDLGKEVAKGLASGGALAGIVDGIDKLTGSSSTTTSKREFSEEDIALLRRAVNLGDLGKEVAKGLASGGALAGIVDGIDKLTGSSSTTTTSKREPLSLGSLGKAILGTGASLATSSVVGDVIDDITGQSSKREAVTPESPKEAGHGLEIFPNHADNDSKLTSPKIEGRGLLSSIVSDADSVITKGIVGGVASGIAGSVVGDIVGSKREALGPEFPGAGHGPAIIPADVAVLDGESLTKREMEVRSLLSKLLGAGSSVVTSSVVGDIISDVTKRETITLPPTLGLGLGPAVLSPDVVALDDQSLTRRELEARGLLSSIVSDADSVITKGIVGGVASGIAGSVVSDIVGSKREATTPSLTPEEIAAIVGTSKHDIDARSLLSSIVSDADSVITKGIVGGVASGIAGSVISDIAGSKRETADFPPVVKGGHGPDIAALEGTSFTGDSLTKREMEVRSLLGKLLGAGSSLVTSSVVGDVIDDVVKREPLSLGSLGKTLLGAGASLATSSVVGDIIDDVTKRDLQLTPEEQLMIALLRQEKSSKRSLNDLD